MDTADSTTPLLTAEQVRAWRDQRDRVADQVRELQAQLSGLNDKLNALSLVLGPELAAKLIGPANADFVKSAEPQKAEELPIQSRPMTDIMLWILRDQKGGRDTKWIREQALADPLLSERIKKSPTAISNALSRLAERGQLHKADNRLYYLPQVWRAIESGDIEEERVGNTGSETFNSLMHNVMRSYGKAFNAAEAIRQGNSHPILKEKLAGQPSRVYSWLSREVFKNKLLKEGDYYRYPEWNEAEPQGLGTMFGPASSSQH